MKIYGISKIIKHPQGFNYMCAYLDENKTLENSTLIIAWNKKTKERIYDEEELMEKDYTWKEINEAVRYLTTKGHKKEEVKKYIYNFLRGK